jgi:acetyl esterase/lipase
MSIPKIPDALRVLMANIGPRWRSDTRGHIALMVQEFTKVLSDSPKDGVNVEPDLRYGSHERQVLDVYSPTGVSERKPGLIFVHGGGFTDGHRNRTSEIMPTSRIFSRATVWSASTWDIAWQMMRSIRKVRGTSRRP